jgi:hypothetical protein
MDTKKITLLIPQKRFPFFMELMKSLGFVQFETMDSVDTDEEIRANISQAFRDLQLIREGKLETVAVEHLIAEL